MRLYEQVAQNKENLTQILDELQSLRRYLELPKFNTDYPENNWVNAREMRDRIYRLERMTQDAKEGEEINGKWY